MEFVSVASEKALDFVVERVLQESRYIFFYNRNCKELIELDEKLRAEREEVQHAVEEAERNGREIETKVKRWLEKVNDIINKIEKFNEDKRHKKTGSSNGLFPNNWRSRYQLGKEASKKALEVDGLLKEANFNGVSYRLGPTSFYAALSNTGYENIKSRNETMKSIMKVLQDLTVGMTGIYGPGGVGKTTLVKEVAKQAWKNKLFSVMIYVNVTRNPDPKKIQGEIADTLGLRLEEESEIGRADRLRNRLKKEKKNTLVILDDLWEGLDLTRLGIPFDDDDFNQMSVEDMPGYFDCNPKKEKATGEHKGCKILLTSRDGEVLSTQMGVKKLFSVGFLKKKEAGDLFKKVAGVPDKNPEFERLTAEILKKCEGLPMAIVTVARALTNKGQSEWNDALEQLKRQEFMRVQKPMEFSIKLSYDHLESEELKSVFLLSAQMGNHALVTDLMKYCVGLGILQGVHTLREARSRIHTLIRKLKNSSLLLDSVSNDHLNMHDMVCDVALSIASKEQNVFVVKNGKVDEWPDRDELKRCTAFYIHNSDIIDELPEGINCPQLKVLHIDSDDPSMRIPDKFFDGMTNLRILILNGFNLPQLPTSMACLLNLKMLCLEQCQLGKDLSLIGKLKKLRVLSFSGSEIENLPNELGELGKLQLFDISDCDCFKLKEIPSNFISRLNSLEELYMRNSFLQWDIEGQTNQIQNAILCELRNMHQLTTLDICIPNAELLPANLFFDKLDNYKIVIGDSNMLSMGDFRMPYKYEASRTLALHLKEAKIHSLKGIKMLFKRVENLLLAELNGVENIFEELNLNGFPNLKHLSIVNNSEIKYIINSMESSRPHTDFHTAFPKLESLCLHNLEKMEKVCSYKLTDESFGNLKSIKINACGQLKNLFSFDMVRPLSKLERIEVFECNSLEEIVVGQRNENNDNDEKVNKIEFPKLRSLVLGSLGKFTGFYSDGTMLSESQSTDRQASNSGCNDTVVDARKLASSLLFSEEVTTPNLESLELSEVKIRNIWVEKPLPNSCFQKLIKLNVKDCNSMRYLFTFSMATSLSNLKGLSVSECKVMKEIFIGEDVNKDEAKVSIFPKLEEIQFSSMGSLEKIWPSRVSSDSFGSLTSVVIEKCEKLAMVFPRHMVGRFQKLISLKVFDCQLVAVIFDLENSKPQAKSGYETYLQFLYIKKLPILEHLWNKDPEGILSFKNLQIVEVHECHTLKNLLPFSVAKTLDKLQYLTVLYCNEMEEIISMEQSSKTSSDSLTFPQASFLRFQHLPKLKSFYGGSHDLKWPELKRLEVCYCDNPEAQPILLDEKVICSLEMLTISSMEIEWLEQCIGTYRMHTLKHLRLASLENIGILCRLLHRIPNLEDLSLYRCFFKEVLPLESPNAQENIGTVVQLRGLELWNLSDLQNIGFERDPVSQRIERLRVHRCPRLINIVATSVSFTYLTHLEVSECDALVNLMALSTAKSLVQLTSMKVIGCKMMEEIVGKEGNDEERTQEIIFSKLMTLELASLKNLRSFCSSEKCAFKLPSLEKLIVRDCPIMKVFCKGGTSTPRLQQVHIAEDEGEKSQYWNGTLNATIQRICTDTFACAVEHLDLGDRPMLREIWNGEVRVPVMGFSNLKSLVIKGCEFLSSVIPFNLLPFLSKLEELEVRDCNSVKVIYDVKDITEESKMKNLGRDLSSTLKKLILKELPNLEHVWNRDPQGIVGLQNLQEVHVERCKCLRSLFPESMAKDLLKVRNLVVRCCEKMVEIISKDDEAAREATKEFEFPCVTSLTLSELPMLKWFYPGPHRITCPQLKNLDVHHCIMLKLETLTSEYESDQTTLPEDHALMPLAKVFPNLEKLSLNKGHSMMSWHGQSQENLLQELKSVVLQCFHSQSDIFPYGFLQNVPHIEEVEVRCCYFKKIFSMDRPDNNYTGVFSQLKRLKLKFLPELNSIGLEHSWVDSIPEKLETLEVDSCPCLLNLAPSTVIFSNLKDLTVFECHRLQYLLTSSTAKSMCLLEKMSIRQCESLQEILAKEGDKFEHDEIIFEQLKTLYLDSLPSLSNFYTGCYTLSFPSLEKVSVFECCKMKNFCQRQDQVVAPQLKGVEFQEHISELKLVGVESQERTDRVRWEGDLYTTIEKAYDEMAAVFPTYVQHLKLGDHPKLEKIWSGKVHIPDTWFSNLKSLIVEGCKLSSIIPSKLLSSLSTLEDLEVRNCDSVKVIFDMNDGTGDSKIGQASPLHLSLKKLSLEGLPKMEHVWNNDTQGIFTLHALQEMHVDRCNSLISLFPASIAKDLMKLEDLKVRYCGGLEEIVAQDEAAEGATEKFVFPCMTTVILDDLPRLMKFYPGKHELECPRLKNLQVHLCSKLRIFAPEFETDPQEHPENEVGIPIVPSKPTALLSVEKVVPNLEQLSVTNEDIMMIYQENFQGMLLQLKSLELHGFDDKSTFPYGFLQEVHNVEKLQVSYSSFKVIFSYATWEETCSDITGFNSLLDSPVRPRLDPVATGMLSQLKVLSLNDLPELRSIGLEVSWMKPISEGLKTLEVCRCPSLLNLVPSKACFSNLKDLSVSKCHDLQYLFTSSAAKSMHLLEKMCVCQCDALQEIVAKEEDESHQGKINFRQLNSLYLDSLPRLVSFYTGSSTLKFPSLEQVSVFECREMIVFCQSDVRTPKLLGVEFKGHIDDVRWFGNLNTTIWMPFAQTIIKFACDVQHLKLREHPELKEIWNGVVSAPDTCFRNLKSLVVEGCEFLSTVIPFVVISFLSNLKELAVQNCNSAKLIFDVRDIRGDGRTKNMEPALFLTKVNLAQLPNLEHVWSKESQGFDGLQRLEEVYIDGCKKLRSLFPASVAKYLVKLKRLDLKCCDDLVEIVGKDEPTTEGALKECVLSAPSFSNLRELRLAECHRLKYLFRPSTAKSLVKLEKIIIENCESIIEIVAGEENDLTQDEIIFGQLKELHLNYLSSLERFYEGHSTLSFPYLVEAIIIQCPRMKIFSQGIIRAPMLEVLQTSPKRRDRCQEGTLNHTIKTLFKREVAKLARNIHTLELCVYPELEEIFCGVVPAPDESCFGNLKLLVVEGCKCLSTVIPSNLLIFLNNLEELVVRNCDSVKVIFGLEDGEMTRMVTASSQSFPSVKKVILENLPNLEHVWKMIDDDQGNFSFPVPEESYFRNLKLLVVEGCKCLSIVIPFNLPTLVNNLEELVVRNCDSVKVIFDLEDGEMTRMVTASSERFPSVKKVTLEKLPNLEHVWKMIDDDQGNFSFPVLQTVLVDECKSLKSLFPPTMAKGLVKLEELQVTYCKGLVEIVAKNEAVTEGATEKFIFPSLMSVILCELPELKHFYPGLHKLKWPLLKELDVHRCHNLKLTAESPNFHVIRQLFSWFKRLISRTGINCHSESQTP